MFTNFSIEEQVLFAKRLSFLTSANISLVESLTLIRNQTKSKYKIHVYDTLVSNVASGQYLSSSLMQYQKLFGDFTIHIIRIGEESGTLSQNLTYLAEELYKKQQLRRKVLGALIYPIFIVLATFGITGTLTVYIFPKLLPIFASLHVTLPLTTRALIATSSFLSNYGLYCILLLASCMGGTLFARSKYEAFRAKLDRILLNIPFCGRITKSYNLANTCRTLGILLRSGIGITEALHIIAETTTNRIYRQAFSSIAESVRRGEKVSVGLLRHGDIFPDILSHLVGIGETTGDLSGTLVYVSSMYDSDVDELTKGLSNSIEPILMLTMGLIVGLIAVSVITPIYAVTQHLQLH